MPDPTAEAAVPRPTYRIRKLRRADATAKGYRHTLVISDEHTGATLATADVVGLLASALVIETAAHARVRLAPNRSLLPTSFSLCDESGRVEMQFDLQVARKLLTPLTRVAFVLHERTGGEPLRLTDTRSSLGERMLGVSSGDWSLVRGDETVATLTRLPPREPTAKGIRGWVLGALTPSDRGLVSFGEQHVISATAALATVALFNQLTAASG